MKYERTIQTLRRAGFVVMRNIRPSTVRPGTTYEEGFTARLPSAKRRIEASRQADEIITMRVVRDNDHDDLQSDYHAGAWVETVKRAVELASIVDDSQSCNCHLEVPTGQPMPNYCPIHDGDYESWLVANNID